jgi:hypothetical protein
VSEHALAEALIAAERIRPDQSTDRGIVEKAVADLVADFIGRFCPAGTYKTGGRW